MVRMIPNANAQAGELLFRNSVVAFYKAVCNDFTNNFENTFITNVQMFVTKIGIVISQVANGPNISQCIQSINYICNNVLENADLIKTFMSLGLNSKGNRGKHSIQENHIEMSKCVAFLNTVIISVSEKCGLPVLKKFIIRKNKAGVPQNVPVSGMRPEKIKKAVEPQNYRTNSEDENMRLRLEILPGNGKYTKGILNKVNMLNFRLKVNIYNPDGFKLIKVIAYITSGKQKIREVTLENDEESLTDIDIVEAALKGPVVVTVKAKYSIGFCKTKEIKASVSRSFK